MINCGMQVNSATAVNDCPPQRPTYIADKLDEVQLRVVRDEQRAIHEKLIQLEGEHQKLNSLIIRSRERPVDLNCELLRKKLSEDLERVDQLEPVVCVTCCSEVSARHALKHMAKCFQKMEGSTTFCANQKEQVMGTPLFCDRYDPQARAYCKRLRQVCEHTKDPKLPPDTPCGCPLVRDVFVEMGSFCRIPRTKCVRHSGWERVRRARIDVERYRHLIRMDELMQEEQRLLTAVSQRGGFLATLLNRTHDMNPSVPVPLPSHIKSAIGQLPS